jgi:ABC-type nitrate/sulfonate/bicarbonate transport system permease component
MSSSLSGQRGKRMALAICLPLAFLLLWEVLGRFNLLIDGLIPTPSAVMRAWWVWIAGPGGLSLNP